MTESEAREFIAIATRICCGPDYAVDVFPEQVRVWQRVLRQFTPEQAEEAAYRFAEGKKGMPRPSEIKTILLTMQTGVVPTTDQPLEYFHLACEIAPEHFPNRHGWYFPVILVKGSPTDSVGRKNLMETERQGAERVNGGKWIAVGDVQPNGVIHSATEAQMKEWRRQIRNEPTAEEKYGKAESYGDIAKNLRAVGQPKPKSIGEIITRDFVQLREERIKSNEDSIPF